MRVPLTLERLEILLDRFEARYGERPATIYVGSRLRRELITEAAQRIGHGIDGRGALRAFGIPVERSSTLDEDELYLKRDRFVFAFDLSANYEVPA